MSKYQLAKQIGYIQHILGMFRGNVTSMIKKTKPVSGVLKHMSGNQYLNKGAVAMAA